MSLRFNLLRGITIIALVLILPAAALGLQLASNVEQGAVLVGQLSDDEQAVYLGDQLLPLSKDRRFIVGLDRDHGDELKLTVVGLDGQSSDHRFAVRARDYRIQRVEGIARKIMNPNADDLNRIRAESALVREARAQHSAQESYLQPFVWPIKGPITGVYGSQRVYNGVPGRPHYGVDVAAPVGAKVRAPAAGTVSLVHDNMFYSGGTLIIDHGHGLSSSFLHLSKILVEPGQQLTGGELIAEVGATGRATGPHLDWRMNWRGARVDPELLVPPMIQSQTDAD
ncbi:MAG: M23 family metallopeptidase [Pseudomonadota bacterium]